MGDADGPLGFGDDPGEEARRERLRRRQDPDLVAEGRPATGRPQTQPAARLPAGASRYGWFVGVVGVLLIAVVTLNTFRTGSKGPGSRGITAGGTAPPFAAPLALSNLQGDVNVATKANSGDAGSVPACSIRRPDVLNLCTLTAKGPVVLAFFATRGGECVRQLDRLDDARARHPEISFAAVSIRGDRAGLRRTIRDRGWRFPIGYDADGILANAYGVAVCPQITFLRKGGAVLSTTLGAIDARELERRIRALEAG